MTSATANLAFMVDHMLVRLGKYLRICGFDAEWQLGGRTHELILRANAEDRVFLTCNRHIEENYPIPRRWRRVLATTPVEQLREVIAVFGLDPTANLFRKCIRCNCFLDSVPDRRDVAEHVPPEVLARYERFWRCPSCGTVFWHGSHVRNTCRKLGMAPPSP